MIVHSTRFRRTLALFSLLFSLCLSSLFADFAVFSDTQYDDATHASIVNAIAAHHPTAAFLCGDLTNKGRTQAEYDKFFAIEKPLTDICPLYAARGNHEHSEELFLANFPFLQGKTFYSVEHDSLLFIILDCNKELKPLSEQYIWLQKELTEHPDRAKIVIIHFPIFSSGYHGTDEELTLFLPELWKGCRVAAVCSGHDHDYERLEFEGVTYFVTGGSGGYIREGGTTSPYSKSFSNTHNYLIFSRQGKTLSCTVYDLEGKTLDNCVIALP